MAGKDFLRSNEDDPTIAVAVLTGAGARAFCTGADVRRQAERHRTRDPRQEVVVYRWQPERFAQLLIPLDRVAGGEPVREQLRR